MRKLLDLVLATSMLATPLAVFAQADGTVQGSVMDESKGALPGATLTLTELTTGRQHVAVTDPRGEYRLVNVAAGAYKLQADLSGFASTIVPRLELLVGQSANVAITMRLASVQENVTVTGETPLVDTRSSQVSANVDRRQMEELPLQGRNWIELSLLVKGVTGNSADNTPGVRERDFNLSLDGEQIIQNRAQTAIGQPKFSREAIAEFQLVTNLFDVTQGRSTGVRVQAVTRAGTNKTSGSLYGYFRDDSLNAPDPIARTVLPHENQQLGGAFGGPIRQDKLLYFGTFEYEREPQTLILKPPSLPNQNFIFPNTQTQRSATVRVDQNLSTFSTTTTSARTTVR
jgi:Carboxypeptidase regulatory-like domain